MIITEDLAGQDFVAVNQAFVLVDERQRSRAATPDVVGKFNACRLDGDQLSDFGGDFFGPILAGVFTREFE